MTRNTIPGPAVSIGKRDLLLCTKGILQMNETDLDKIKWRTSSASNSNGCVEVGFTDQTVFVRDSTNRSGAVLDVSWSTWGALIDKAKGGQYDL